MTDAAYYDTPPAQVVPFTAGGASGVGRLQKAARADISAHLHEQDLAELGANVVQDWERDKAGNKEWRDRAEEALKAAAQELPEEKDYPFKRASNVRYPLLTIAGLQFAARAYPAIVKGDEAIKVKTFGKDPQGLKNQRADRMAEYLNWKLFYSVDGWEADTDAMLHRLPSVGQHFRKVYHDPIENRPVIESVSALRLTIPQDARSLQSSPRITHDFDRHPYELQRLMAAGAYRTVELIQEGEDDQGPRLILEQHRYADLDNDGLDEPYIVTVDYATTQVLRIEEGFDEDGIKQDAQGSIISIDRWCPFVDYGFIPDPKGRAYSIGFGHLLTPIMEVVNTIINLEIDAGHAQVAGGGFISQEVRLQGAGQNGVLRFQPGEYKTVLASATDMRNAIWERTLPPPSDVLFQLLGTLMEAAKDIASVNEAITGDASRTAPVGTTLALIEQGQQVFNAIYKRIYRGLREEFRLFADCLKRYGDPAEYARFCDFETSPPAGPPPAPQPDQAAPGMAAQGPQQTASGGLLQPPPEKPTSGLAGPMSAQEVPGMAGPAIDPAALFKADFDDEDLDIRPVADPGAVTKAQLLAKDQFALQFIGHGIYAADRAVIRQALLDAGLEQAEAWIPEQPPAPPPPDPVQIQMIASKVHEMEARATKAQADATLSSARAAEIAHESTGPQADMKLAAAHAKALHDLATAASEASGVLTNVGQGGENGPVPVAPLPPTVE